LPDSGQFKKSQQVVNPEAKFIERLKKGEPSAFSEVLQKHSPLVYKFLFRFLGDRKQADEALMAIMKAVVECIPELGESDKIDGIIWRETHKAAVKMAFGGKGPAAPKAGSKKTYPPPEYLTQINDVTIRKLVTAWEELDPPYREALALSGIEPLIDEEQAGSIIEGTQGTLRSRLSYALRQFMRDM